MNYEMMVYILMNISKIEGMLLLIPTIVSLIYGEHDVAKKIGLLAVFFILVGYIFTMKKPRKIDIFAKDGILIVGIAWIIFSIIGSLPFYITGSIPSFIDAFF